MFNSEVTDMQRRHFLAATTTVTTAAIAGCNTNDSKTEEPTDKPDNTTVETDTKTVTNTETETDTTTNQTTEDSTETTTKEQTETENGPKEPSNTPESLMEVVYDAWAATDSETFLGQRHSINNYPEDGFAGALPPFDGTVTALELEVNKDIPEGQIEATFDAAQHLERADASKFADSITAEVTVNATVEGETNSDRTQNFKEFLNNPSSHFIAVEDGKWRLVT